MLAELSTEPIWEHITLVGALVLAIWAFVQRLVVSGRTYDRDMSGKDAYAVELRRDRDLWMNACLQTTEIIQEQSVTHEKLCDQVSEISRKIEMIAKELEKQ